MRIEAQYFARRYPRPPVKNCESRKNAKEAFELNHPYNNISSHSSFSVEKF
jgi:hypothetical protein